MVRPELQALAPAPKDSLGALVKWFDNVQEHMTRLQPITGEENAFIDSTYFEACDTWAKTQQVPLGFVIGSVAELVRQRVVKRAENQMELDLG